MLKVAKRVALESSHNKKEMCLTRREEICHQEIDDLMKEMRHVYKFITG